MGQTEFEKAIASFDSVNIDHKEGVGLLEFLAGTTGVYTSNGEARRALQGNAVAINKEKIREDFQIEDKDWLYGAYLIISKGKKKHIIVNRGVK